MANLAEPAVAGSRLGHQPPRHAMLDTWLHLAGAEAGGSATDIVDAGTGPLTAKPSPRQRSGGERTRPARARRGLAPRAGRIRPALGRALWPGRGAHGGDPPPVLPPQRSGSSSGRRRARPRNTAIAAARTRRSPAPSPARPGADRAVRARHGS